MSDVRIRMDADLGGTQAALRRAQEDVRKLTDRMRELGKAGQDFGKIDFGQLPGDMSKHMERVQKQYRDLLALNNDLRRRIQMSGQEGASPFDLDWDRMGYLNRRTQEEARRRVIEQSARGTPWQPPAGGGGGAGPPPAEAGESGGRGGGFGGMAATVWGGLKLGAGIMGLQTGLGLISQAFQGARNTAQANDQFIRRTRETGETFTSVRDRLKALGDGLQLTNEESAQLGLAFQKAANEADPQTAIAGARGAAGFGRSYGIAPEVTAQSMGALQFLGATGKGGLSQRQMLLLIGKTISDGMLGGKAEQVIEGLGRHVETFVGKTMQAPGDIAEYMGLIAAMGQLKDKYPGLAGPGGARLIEQAGQAIQSPGGGLGGEFLMTRALQSAGLGGGDPFKLLYERQGMTALTKLPNGKTAIEQFMDEANRHLGGGNPYQASVMTGEVLGMTGKQVTALQAALQRARGTGGGIDAWETRLKAAGVDITKVNESGIKDIGDIMAASPDTLKEIGARRGVDPGLQGEALRDALLKIAAEQGRQQNEATKAQDAMVSALNALQNAIGQPLLDALGQLGQAVKELTPPVKGIAEWLDIKTGTAAGTAETQATGANSSIFSASRWGYELNPRNWFKRSDEPSTVERLDNWLNRNNPEHPGGYHDPRDEMMRRTAPATPQRTAPDAPAGSNVGTGNARLGALSRDPAFLAHLRQLEDRKGLPRGMLWAQIAQESRFNPGATSPKGARGIAQFMPATAARFGLDDPSDPYESARAMADYNAFLYKRFGGDIDKTLAGYNAGEGNVDKYGGVPPFRETRGYVSAIKGRWWPQAPAESAGFDASLLRPKPRDDYTPLPEGATPAPAATPASDPGRVDIYLHQRDSKGAPVGSPAQHHLDLTRRSPQGSINVDSLFGAPA